MPFTTPPSPPTLADPSNFNSRAEAYLAWLSVFAGELQAMLPAESAAALAQYLASNSSGYGAALIGKLGGGTLQDTATLAASTAGTVSAHTASIAALQARDADALQALAADLAAGTAASVACFGDSTMWGADPANLTAQVALPPTTALANFVNGFHGNTALTVTNAAISGTTATQMIAGTDGSGSTFAARVAASSARVVCCNHGINDAYGSNATTLTAYRTALLAFVAQTRAAGKTPVLVTPFPALTLGAFGNQARAEATARFAQAMRDVATAQGVTLVDNHRTISRLLQIDGQLPLTLLPDGVHGSQGLYGFAGNQLAGAILGALAPSLSRSGQRLAASGPAIRATSQTMNPSTASRVGCVVTTGSSGSQSLRMVFRVDEPGMDLVMGHPVFSAGSGAIAVSLDGASQGTLSQNVAGFASPFWQDYETVVARNLAPGFHILSLSCSGGGGIGLHYLRSRPAERPLMLPSGSAVPSQRALLLEYKLDLSSSTGDTLCVFDDLPASRFLDDLELEWSSQMLKSSAVVIGGNVGANNSAAAAERAISIGLDSAGKLALWEATAPGTYTLTTVGASDLSTASHLYRVRITTAGAVTLWVDDVQIGTATLTGPYRGGLLGLWKSQAGGTLTVIDLCRVWRL